MIEVRVPMARIAAIENEINKMNTMMVELSNNGIPLMGTLLPWAIKTGTLVVTADDVFEDYVYQWYPTGEQP